MDKKLTFLQVLPKVTQHRPVEFLQWVYLADFEYHFNDLSHFFKCSSVVYFAS